ncbi:PIG-L deacetylase family protein [Methanoregula sp.]|uniref:PIG-L deacetylase family protein n=1 Tax=Methanoregula sp. TaxID=2052170 RepID=UPI000CBE0BC4|nr:PIG-L deacetylase family protein [Methanoregula sp.]PKG31515.1 MAG: PIG-L domain-containing protein [Methanoregula sp.]
MNVLVIAPHPDDEVLGCGGTIYRLAQEGNNVALCIVTKPYPPDWSEAYIQKKHIEIEQSNKKLGISRMIPLGFPTVKLDTVPQKDLNDALSEIIRDVRPDLVFIPHNGDLNKDHRIVHEAALVATRPLSSPVKKILSYETLSETEWGRTLARFLPGVYFDITDYREMKLDAMKLFETELRLPPHPRSAELIAALATKRGSEIGVKYAEAFMLVREII